MESQAGVGSVFSFEIPSRVDSGTQSNDIAYSVADTPNLGLILITDDEQQARSIASSIVRSEGYDVIEASNADDGIRLARQYKPDAIILDIIMPERDGWSMLKEIKSDEALQNTPVILATMVADRDMGLAFGAVEHLTKPIEPAKLIATLEAIAEGQDKDVLVVDDDDATRILFRRILSREGWNVREAADGKHALRELEKRKPTLMVLDIMMPNIDGFDVLKSIRATDNLADLPVIVATSKDLNRDELTWLNTHAGEVIRKGTIGRTELLTALKRQLDRPT